MIWKNYFEDLNNIHNQEQVAVNMRVFDSVQRGNYFGVCLWPSLQLKGITFPFFIFLLLLLSLLSWPDAC